MRDWLEAEMEGRGSENWEGRGRGKWESAAETRREGPGVGSVRTFVRLGPAEAENCRRGTAGSANAVSANAVEGEEMDGVVVGGAGFVLHFFCGVGIVAE